MLKAWKRIRNYIKYDLREIIAPSSLPYPPGEEPPEKGWKDFFQVILSNFWWAFRAQYYGGFQSPRMSMGIFISHITTTLC